MKNNQKGFETSSVVVIIALVVLIGFFVYSQKQPKDVVVDENISSQSAEDSVPNTQSSQSSTFTIKELGISFNVTNDLKDLVYTIQDFGGENGKIARLSSKTLIDADKNTGGNTCINGGLGYVSLTRKGDGLYVPTGSYGRPDDRCSANSEVQTLQYNLIASLENALKTAVRTTN